MHEPLQRKMPAPQKKTSPMSAPMQRQKSLNYGSINQTSLPRYPQSIFIKPLQASETIQRMPEDSVSSPQPILSTPNNTGIPTQMKRAFEEKSGYLFDDVRIHYNSEKPAQLQALAYTQGNQVYIGANQEKHLEHELGHVVQQKLGRVHPESMINGVPVNQNPDLEAEASRIGGLNFSNSADGQVKTVVPVVQCFPAEAQYVWAYARVKKGVTLSAKLAKELANFINSQVPDPDPYGFTKPKLDILDPYFHQYAISGKQPQTFLVDDVKLDFCPMPQLGGTNIFGIDYKKNISEIIASLTDKAKSTFFALLSILRTYCNEDGIRSVIQGAAINVKRQATFVDQGMNDRAHQLFINRLSLMTQYIKTVGEQNVSGTLWGKIKIKDKYWIKSTGSDPHANGQHALFLIEKKNPNNKKLYKPHSLQFENAILGQGENKFIQSVNGFLPRGNKLPTMKFNPDEHTEDFIQRVGDYNRPLTEDKIQQQYFKLGMLEANMRVAGITDLHGENIMFTQNGPIPVDAECGGHFASTGIIDSSGPGKISEIDSFLNASALYKDGPQQAMLSEYKQYFENGKRYMEAILYTNRAAVRNALAQSLQNVDSWRAVPINTSDLASDLESYGRGDDPRTIANARLHIIKNYFVSSVRAYYQVGITANINKTIYEGAFAVALEAGTLPAFSLQMNPSARIPAGAILMDGHQIGQLQIPNGTGGFVNITADQMRQNYVAHANVVLNSYEKTTAFKSTLKTVIQNNTHKDDAVCQGVADEIAGNLLEAPDSDARAIIIRNALAAERMSIAEADLANKTQQILTDARYLAFFS